MQGRGPLVVLGIDLCSLREGVDRLTRTVRFEVDIFGGAAATAIHTVCVHDAIPVSSGCRQGGAAAGEPVTDRRRLIVDVPDEAAQVALGVDLGHACGTNALLFLPGYLAWTVPVVVAYGGWLVYTRLGKPIDKAGPAEGADAGEEEE